MEHGVPVFVGKPVLVTPELYDVPRHWAGARLTHTAAGCDVPKRIVEQLKQQVHSWRMRNVLGNRLPTRKALLYNPVLIQPRVGKGVDEDAD